MEMSCPSCGIKHNTEDHVGAFEIECSCGYSILLPDEKAFKIEERPSLYDPPTTMDEEDKEKALQPEFSQVANPVDSTASTLTPPEDLPKDMVYDPFEVQNLNPNLESVASEAESELLQETRPNDLPDEEQKREPESTGPALSGQTIVNRSQSAAMGQFIGASYNIQCKDLSRESLVALSKRCQDLLKGRPWLDGELRKRNINIDKLADNPDLDLVPELIAVELYLGCYELGGRCESQKVG